MMADLEAIVVKSATHVAKMPHNCRGCGYVIRPGQRYQAVTYSTRRGFVFAKLDEHCLPHPVNAHSDITYSIPAEAPEPWGTP